MCNVYLYRLVHLIAPSQPVAPVGLHERSGEEGRRAKMGTSKWRSVSTDEDDSYAVERSMPPIRRDICKSFSIGTQWWTAGSTRG